jgi:hypothetical protein
MKRLIFGLVIGSNLVALMPLSAIAQTYNFTVTNDTDSDITELYVDDADETEWGDDLMEGDVIAPGETAAFEWADEDVEDGDPCDYHVLAILSDDTAAQEIEEGINFCENPSVVVTDS